MKLKAIFLDFYGTLVHEDDDILPIIYRQIKENTVEDCELSDIGRYWWKTFSDMYQRSYHETFQTQRELGISSLRETISKYKSNCDAESLIQIQFNHWQEPVIYEDTIPFLNAMRDYKIYILSNIDTQDILAAVAHHGIKVDEIITSEDVKSYKPRPELFLEAMRSSNISADEVIHIGDSYLSDVGGARNVGIKNVWLNRLGRTTPNDLKHDFICKDLWEVKDMINGIEDGSINL